MIEGIESFYKIFAESIEESIDSDWEFAEVEVTFFPDSSTYIGEYTTIEGVQRSFPIDNRAARAFRELREKFKSAGKRLWGKATFELNADGKFNMKMDYDNCDDNGFAIFDAEQEIQNTLNRHNRLTR